jgi:hypothetical protein
MEILILPSCELCTDCVPPISIYRKYGKDWLAHRAHRAHAEHRAHRAHAEHRAHRAMKLRSAVGYGTYTGYPLYSRALWTAHCTEHNHMQHSSVSKVQYSAGRIPSTRDSPPWRQSRSPRTGAAAPRRARRRRRRRDSWRRQRLLRRRRRLRPRWWMWWRCKRWACGWGPGGKSTTD